MKRFLAIFVAMLVTMTGVNAFAGPSVSPFSTFRSFRQLSTPGVESIVDIESDAVAARYVLRFGEEFSDTAKIRLGSELESVPGYRDHEWRSDSDVVVTFRSPIVRVGVMQWKEGRREVVIGVVRDHGFLPRFLGGPAACRALLPLNLDRVRPLFDAACNGETPDLRETRDFGSSPAEEEVFEMIRLQMRAGWQVDKDRLETYTERADHDRVIVFGYLMLAMAHAIDLEHERVLEVLTEIQTLVDDQPNSITPEQQAFARRLGEVSFFRLIDVSLAGEGLAALTYWESYRRWAPEDFDPQLKLRVAELYRRSLAPEKAAPIYLEIIAIRPANEVELLIELGRTYREAKDMIRATATAAYLRERYPNAYLPEQLRSLRDAPLQAKRSKE